MALTVQEIYERVEKDSKNIETMARVILRYIDYNVLEYLGKIVLRDGLTEEEQNEIRVAYNKYRAAPYEWYGKLEELETNQEK